MHHRSLARKSRWPELDPASNPGWSRTFALTRTPSLPFGWAQQRDDDQESARRMRRFCRRLVHVAEADGIHLEEDFCGRSTRRDSTRPRLWWRLPCARGPRMSPRHSNSAETSVSSLSQPQQSRNRCLPRPCSRVTIECGSDPVIGAAFLLQQPPAAEAHLSASELC
jgi:hypothetical protein